MTATLTAPVPKPVVLWGRWTPAQTVALAMGIAGSLLMAAIASGTLYPIPRPFFCSHLYDLYAHRLFVEGHWDLPMRDLKVEGHFTPDGKGYLYYGLAPLVTRIPLLPFVDMPTTWIASFSIWLWASIGNLAYHRAFWLALAHGAGGEDRIGGWASALLAGAIWFAAPGLVMSATGAVFDEPVIVAYALVGGIAALLASVCFKGTSLSRAIVPMAVLAGLTVHARPHLAVGMYAMVSLLAASLVLARGTRHWKSAIAAMAILGMSGSALLAINYVRFGNPLALHGGFAHEHVQYAPIFWGTESREGPRAIAFTQFGQFNAHRILPNAMVYFLSPPSNAGNDKILESLQALHARMLQSGDAVTFNQPRVGVMFLWPAWLLLMIVGLRQRQTWRMPAGAAMAGVIIAGCFTLGYMTIALRYHVDLWPLIAFPAMFGLSEIARRGMSAESEQRLWRTVLLGLATLGMFVTLQKTVHARSVFLENEGFLSREFCVGLAEKKGFSPQRIAEICGWASDIEQKWKAKL